MEGRRRLSRGSSEVQTAQPQPIVGTPTLVPEPSTTMLSESAAMLLGSLFRFFFRRWSFLRLSFLRLGFFRFSFLTGRLECLHETESQLGDGVFNQALLLDAEIAPGLLLNHGEHVDGVARHSEVGFGAVLLLAEVQHSQLNLGLRFEREG